MFCSSCGKELPDEASFCFGCGKPTNQPLQKTKGLATKIVQTMGAALLLCFAAWYFANALKESKKGTGSLSRSSLADSIRYQSASDTLLKDTLNVKAGSVRYKTFRVSGTIRSPHVVGSFRASGGSGNDVEVVVAEWPDCENWMNGHSAQVLYSSGKTTNGRFDVPVRNNGEYCVAFNNKFSLVTAKQVAVSVELQYMRGR